jgi:predicted DNA-binding antitoxin AbrB/MazE fold protein
MSQVITATYTDGIFKPDVPVNLSPGVRVRLVLEPLEPAPELVEDAWEDLEQLCVEFPVDSGGLRLTRDQLHERR